MRYLALILCILIGSPTFAADQPPATEPVPAIMADDQASHAATEPAADEPAQIVLMIGDREPVTLATGPWQAMQFLVSQVAVAADAMQWRQLRARMIPFQPQKVPQ